MWAAFAAEKVRIQTRNAMTQVPPCLAAGSLSDEDNVLSVAPQGDGLSADTLWLMNEIVQRSPIGVAVIDYEGVFLSVNPSYCLIYDRLSASASSRCTRTILMIVAAIWTASGKC
jgi:PAS domain-containing protein